MGQGHFFLLWPPLLLSTVKQYDWPFLQPSCWEFGKFEEFVKTFVMKMEKFSNKSTKNVFVKWNKICFEVVNSWWTSWTINLKILFCCNNIKPKNIYHVYYKIKFWIDIITKWIVSLFDTINSSISIHICIHKGAELK